MPTEKVDVRLNEPRAIIIAAVITGICGILAIFIAATLNSTLPPPLPAGLPSATPKPTVVGTPLIGADIAAGGKVGFVVVANNISVIVDEVRAYQSNPEGFPAGEGYAFVVVKMRINNGSEWPIIGHSQLVLIDDYSNQYNTWGVIGFDLPEIPVLKAGESASGAEVYRVPIPALTNALRLRLEASSQGTRIEIFFDPLLVEEP